MDNIDKYLDESTGLTDNCIRILDQISKSAKDGKKTIKKIDNADSIALGDMKRNLLKTIDALNFALYGV